MSDFPAKFGGGVFAASTTTAAIRTMVLRETSTWDSVLFSSLNCRSRIRINEGAIIKATEAQARGAFMHFGNMLDRAVHGRAAQRFDRRVPRIPFLEYAADREWHFHVLIEPPYFLNRQEFMEMIEQCWSRCEWGSTCHFREGDENSAHYVTKGRSKSALEAWTDTLVVEGVVLRTK